MWSPIIIIHSTVKASACMTRACLSAEMRIQRPSLHNSLRWPRHENCDSRRNVSASNTSQFGHSDAIIERVKYSRAFPSRLKTVGASTQCLEWRENNGRPCLGRGARIRWWRRYLEWSTLLELWPWRKSNFIPSVDQQSSGQQSSGLHVGLHAVNKQ